MPGILLFLLLAGGAAPLAADPCRREAASLCSDESRPRGVDLRTCLVVNEDRLGEECRNLVLPKPEDSHLLYYASTLLIGLAVFIIARMIFSDEESYKATEQISEIDERRQRVSYAEHGVVFRYSRPFFKRYIIPVVQSMKAKKGIRDKYRRRLATAGLADVVSPEDFLSFKIFLILGFPIVFMATRFFLEADWSLFLVPVVAVVGFFYPDIWIRGKIQSRQREVVMFMPFTVDMLALSVEAGLDFVAAMTKVVDKARPSALNDEFRTLIKEIKVGASRAEALRNMAWRVDLVQVSSFCATLIAADSVGASVGPILKALSNEIRQKRSSDIEKAGATAATKILFPMLFLIVPAVFVMIAAPVGLQMMTQGGG